eukprot:4320886-Pyramimonas_sp.AAC.1
MRPKAGLGIDQMSPLDFDRLPDCAVAELCELYRLVEEGLSWPWQVLTVVGRPLGKKSGGDRVI